MSKILLLSFMCLTVAWSGVQAQERTVSGIVKSQEDGSVLPGVNVVVKGTATGTVTDSNGSYRLSVSGADGILVFSFIGLTTQEVVIGERNVVDVQLASDVTQLGEVVVTAQGNVRQTRLEIHRGLDSSR